MMVSQYGAVLVPGLKEQGCGQDLAGGEQVHLCHVVLELVLDVAVEGLHCHGSRPAMQFTWTSVVQCWLSCSCVSFILSASSMITPGTCHGGSFPSSFPLLLFLFLLSFQFPLQ